MGTVKYTGPIVSFHCPTNAEIRSLKIHFSPKQEGSGDPSFENIRQIVVCDGVNVVQCRTNLVVSDDPENPNYNWHNTGTGSISYDAANGGFVRGNGTGVAHSAHYERTIGLNFSYDNHHYYYANKDTTVTVSLWYKHNGASTCGNTWPIRITKKAGVAISNIKASNDPIDWTYFSATVALNAGEYVNFLMYNGVWWKDIQIQTNPTATSYEPYKGITTNREFGVLGKNKFDTNCDMWNYTPYTKNGNQITQSGSDERGWADASFKPISLKAGTYTLTCSDGNNFNLRTSIDNYETNISLFSGGGTFILSQDCDVKIKHSVKTGNSYPTTFTVQLELGSTATAYEPYDSKHTVYGGWVDLISGEVCEEWKTIDLGSCTWIHYGQRDSVFYTRTLNNLKVQSAPNTIMCTHYKYEGAPNVTEMNELTISDSQQLNRGNVNICDSNYSEYTVEQFKEAMNGVICAYKAANATTYTIAPMSMSTFLGQNNIWSNADYVEVEYDLHETQTILQRKAFIMANQPHIVKSAATPLQSFNTDLSATLKECKIQFTPIQEGSGDASPSNVRNIAGRSNITITQCNKNLYNPSGVTYSSLPFVSYRYYEFSIPNGTYYVYNDAFTETGANFYALAVVDEAKKGTNSSINGGAWFYHSTAPTLIHTSATLNVTQGHIWFNIAGDVDNSNQWLSKIVVSKEPVSKHVANEEVVTRIVFPATKNIFNKAELINGYYISGDSIVENENFGYTYVDVHGQSSVTISGCYYGSAARFSFYDVNMELLSSSVQKPRTLTVPEDAYYMSVSAIINAESAGYDKDSIQVEYGETETPFEPYGTIYGGEIDVLNGSITSKWISINGTDLQNCNAYIYNEAMYRGTTCTDIGFDVQQLGRSIIGSYTTPEATITNATSNKFCFKAASIWASPDNNPWSFTFNANYQLHLVFNNSDVGITSELTSAQCIELAKTWIANNNVRFVYRVVDSKYKNYNSTPTQLKTLKGNNNIRSDLNTDITVTYWTH